MFNAVQDFNKSDSVESLDPDFDDWYPTAGTTTRDCVANQEEDIELRKNHLTYIKDTTE
jgi:hypothetical protein